MARKLPIGVQSFEKMREDGYVYVDKTAYVWGLVQTTGQYFLSRPRRFGKSLLVSTLRAYFEGRRDLFRGLAIERLEEGAATEEGREPWQARPVFSLSFNAGNYTREGALEAKLEALLTGLELEWGATPGATEPGDRLLALLKAAHERTGYAAPFAADPRELHLIGCTFDSATRQLAGWEER